MRYLLTQSLLNSWLYQYQCTSGYEEQARKSFLNVLNRKWSSTTAAQQRGMDFESMVYDICDKKGNISSPWYEPASRIASSVVGARRQFVGMKKMTISGVDVLLYGRFDALKAGVIYDIKFTKYYEVGKFFSSPQHPMYMGILPEAYEFTYLVSNGFSVWRETYRRDEIKPISGTIASFFDYLDMARLTDVYRAKWRSRS